MNNELDFKSNNVQTLSLSMLKSSYKENDVYGRPLKGIYHYQLIERVAEMAEKNGLQCELEEIFAAQNRNKALPGVVLLPQVEEQYGKNAVQAHILRRVFTTLRITNFDNDEFSTGIAIAFHQQGIQIAIGNLVKICHNQCILNAENSVRSYGLGSLNLDEIFERVNLWLQNCSTEIELERELIEKWKNTFIGKREALYIVGLLSELRLRYDTDKLSLRNRELYPLSLFQINKFLEQILLVFCNQDFITLWNFYNIATNLYKPQSMEIPNLIAQNTCLVRVLKDIFKT